MPATLTAFRARFAEFAATPDAEVELWLETAVEIHGLSTRATLYLTAHLLTLDAAERQAGAVAPLDDRGGIIVEEQFGPQRIKFMQQAAEEKDVFFARTSYGRLFLTLERRATAFSPRVAG